MRDDDGAQPRNRTHFRDGWRPRLLFVSQSEARAASIAELLGKEGFPSSGAFGGRALTLDSAKHFLNRKLAAATASPATEHPSPPPPAAAPVPHVGPALCEAEERLRRGWVSVRGEHLVRLEAEMRELKWTLHNAQEMLRTLGARADKIPRATEEGTRILEAFSGYARRAESEIARHGLKKAGGSAHELD